MFTDRDFGVETVNALEEHLQKWEKNVAQLFRYKNTQGKKKYTKMVKNSFFLIYYQNNYIYNSTNFFTTHI